MSGVDDEKVSRVLDLHDERRRLSHEIRQIIARLDLMPNGGVQNLQPTAVEHEVGRARGGNSPGRIDPNGPREFKLKDADHFRRRFARAHSITALRSILADAQAAEAAWKRTATPERPVRDSPQWKLWVRESPLSDVEIARLYDVSRRKISKIREGYRKLACARCDRDRPRAEMVDGVCGICRGEDERKARQAA